MDNLKKFFVTNSNRNPAVTNARYAKNAQEAAISESKLYEADDLVLSVRECGTTDVQKFRVRCGTEFDVQETATEPTAA